MKVTVIGATGFVGKALVKELIGRNHEVIGIARNTDALEMESPLLKKENLDILDSDQLKEVAGDSEVIVSAYNAGWSNPNLYEDYLKGARSIQKAVDKEKSQRLVVVGGAGTLKAGEGFIVDSPTFPKEIYPGASAVRDYFVNDLQKDENLNWSFFSPALEMHPGITTGRTGNYRYGTTSPVMDGENKSVLSVEDLAVALVDELENKQFVKQQFTAGY